MIIVGQAAMDFNEGTEVYGHPVLSYVCTEKEWEDTKDALKFSCKHQSQFRNVGSILKQNSQLLKFFIADGIFELEDLLAKEEKTDQLINLASYASEEGNERFEKYLKGNF